MKLKRLVRVLHRDFGYFYVGLIISFSFSGILMNHREHWSPQKYTVETQSIQVKLPQEESKMNEDFAKHLAEELGIKDKVRRCNIKKGVFKISFEKHDVEIDVNSGKGEVVAFIKTPIISQTMFLHKTTSNWWIYYSDLFGLSLILIALTGTLMLKGKNSFRQRGWKLALAGVLFPILVLIFLH